MRKTLFMAVLIAACGLAFSQETKAQIMASSADVSYYAPTNSIRASVYISPDYSTQAYYCVYFYAYIYKDDVYQTLFGGDNYCTSGYCVCAGDAYAEKFLPYDPNAEYTIEAEHTVDVYNRYDEESGGIEYYDYYDFFEYTNGDLLYYPNFFSFESQGAPRTVTFSSLLIGVVTGAFSQGAAAGPPHHLKVRSDATVDDCGTKKRRIGFQVVDSTGRRTGTISTRERFYDPNNGTEISSVHNSCRNESISPSGCSTDIGGRFTDQLWVGCPTVGGFCGTNQFTSKWLWCPRGRAEVPLTANTYHIRNTFVHVNGGSQFAPGTELYP